VEVEVVEVVVVVGVVVAVEVEEQVAVAVAVAAALTGPSFGSWITRPFEIHGEMSSVGARRPSQSKLVLLLQLGWSSGGGTPSTVGA
jgi:hypothetical protein